MLILSDWHSLHTSLIDWKEYFPHFSRGVVSHAILNTEDISQKLDDSNLPCATRKNVQHKSFGNFGYKKLEMFHIFRNFALILKSSISMCFLPVHLYMLKIHQEKTSIIKFLFFLRGCCVYTIVKNLITIRI